MTRETRPNVFTQALSGSCAKAFVFVKEAAPALLIIGGLLALPSVAFADGPAHPLAVMDESKTLLSDIFYYAKFLLPGAALVYGGFGGLQKATAGDDEMKAAKAAKTLTNAKWGLIIGLIAAPVCNWLQQYYTGG